MRTSSIITAWGCQPANMYFSTLLLCSLQLLKDLLFIDIVDFPYNNMFPTCPLLKKMLLPLYCLNNFFKPLNFKFLYHNSIHHLSALCKYFHYVESNAQQNRWAIKESSDFTAMWITKQSFSQFGTNNFIASWRASYPRCISGRSKAAKTISLSNVLNCLSTGILQHFPCRTPNMQYKPASLVQQK